MLTRIILDKVESRCVGQGRYEYRLGERAEEGDSEITGTRNTPTCESIGATEGRITLAESSPRVMGKGESERMTNVVESGRKENGIYKTTMPSDSPTPLKWDDWSHLGKEEKQGRMF